ncbi:hypothetical protein D6745_00380 [Candidatus Woesearchaeota archaeon]|nr:MAG: hypothetical protein D6745_00380 [Candidatus Woesearchaeota archaeon]
MKNIELLSNLFDRKKLSILKVFFDEPEHQFYLREVAKKSGIPVATTYRFVKQLLQAGIIKQIMVNKFKLYQLASNDKSKFLEQFIKEDKKALDVFTEKIAVIEGVESIIMQGKPTKNKANILIIGKNIDSNKVKEAEVEVREEYGFNIYSLSLERVQFEQMLQMGLYAGEKKVLWSKPE